MNTKYNLVSVEDKSKDCATDCNLILFMKLVVKYSFLITLEAHVARNRNPFSYKSHLPVLEK